MCMLSCNTAVHQDVKVIWTGQLVIADVEMFLAFFTLSTDTFLPPPHTPLCSAGCALADIRTII